MKLILVGLDASPRAPEVLSTAIDLAQKTGAKLRLFRAVGLPPEMPTHLYSVSPNRVGELLLEDAMKALGATAEGVPPEVLDGFDAEIGAPWYAICAAAKHHAADLIVVGSHGYGGLDRLLGTTAAKVVNHADRSVMVVRPSPN